MRITRVHPDQLHPTAGYAHVTLVESGRLAVLAGQCPLDEAGELVGTGDVVAQVDRVVTNAVRALAAVGAEPSDVIRSVIYVASGEHDVLAEVWQRLTESMLGPAFSTASTLVGVAALGYEGQLVEVDLTAAVD